MRQGLRTCVTGWKGTRGRTAGTDALSMVMVMLTLMVMVRPVELKPALAPRPGDDQITGRCAELATVVQQDAGLGLIKRWEVARRKRARSELSR